MGDPQMPAGDEDEIRTAPVDYSTGAAEDVSEPLEAEEGLDGEAVLEAEAAVEADIATIAAERDDYLDALRRLQADFENYKKRTIKQQTDHLERAAQGLVDKLLPVLDAADLAIAHGGGEAVEQIGQLLMDTLIKEGLEGIAPQAGDPFDPNEHEAVVHEPAEGEPHVVELLRAGYRWKGRLLRAAMVKVRG